MILENEDIYFLSAPTDESKIWNLAINKIHNGKIESKVLLENISGISNITNIDQHTLLAEIVYKYSNKKLLVRKLVRITLI